MNASSRTPSVTTSVRSVACGTPRTGDHRALRHRHVGPEDERPLGVARVRGRNRRDPRVPEPAHGERRAAVARDEDVEALDDARRSHHDADERAGEQRDREPAEPLHRDARRGGDRVARDSLDQAREVERGELLRAHGLVLLRAFHQAERAERTLSHLPVRRDEHALHGQPRAPRRAATANGDHELKPEDARDARSGGKPCDRRPEAGQVRPEDDGRQEQREQRLLDGPARLRVPGAANPVNRLGARAGARARSGWPGPEGRGPRWRLRQRHPGELSGNSRRGRAPWVAFLPAYSSILGRCVTLEGSRWTRAASSASCSPFRTRPSAWGGSRPR